MSLCTEHLLMAYLKPHNHGISMSQFMNIFKILDTAGHRPASHSFTVVDDDGWTAAAVSNNMEKSSTECHNLDLRVETGK